MGLDFNIVGLEKRERQIVAFENPRVVLNWNFCVLFPVYKEMMQNNTDAYFWPHFYRVSRQILEQFCCKNTKMTVANIWTWIPTYIDSLHTWIPLGMNPYLFESLQT